ncbi:MAG: YfcE family phosphodiesterase [Candidatus Fermentibacter sp.]|nr:YfcE family phosphodiesterase [Candidatus Fermentibacter sp.]
MRIVVLSDTHVPTRASGIPGRVYEECANCDLVIHAGDFVESFVLEDLERLAPVRGVLGNMDGFDLSRLLSQKLVFELEGSRIGLIHGWGPPWDLEARVRKSFDVEPDIIIHGHSHEWQEKWTGEKLLLNPGSASGGHGSSFAVLTLEEGALPSVERISL